MKIKIYFLATIAFILININILAADKDKKMFSSRYIKNRSYEFIINKEKAFIRKLDNGIPDRNLLQMSDINQTTSYMSPSPYNPKAKDSCETPDKKKGRIVELQGKNVCLEIPEPPRPDKYQYQEIPDGCYELENGFIGCFVANKLVEIKKEINKYINNQIDIFFFEKSLRCKELKFDLIEKIFIKKIDLIFKEFQLFHTGYPDLTRIIVMQDREDLTPNIDKEIFTTNNYKILHNILNQISNGEKIKIKGSKKLRAFYLSSRNEIGCLDKQFSILKISDIAETKNDYMYNNKYLDLGKWYKKDGIEKIAMITYEDMVLYINKEIYNLN